MLKATILYAWRRGSFRVRVGVGVRVRVNVYNRSVGGIRCFRDLQTSANYAKKAEMK